jgi:hypothetical protein
VGSVLDLRSSEPYRIHPVFVPEFRISLITPCLNSVAELTECPAALGRASRPGAGYIVVDDGSDKNPFLLRGIPWTLVFLRDRSIPDALNVNYKNRASVALAALGSLACMAGFVRPDAFPAALVLLGLALWLNGGLNTFLRKRRGWGFASAYFIHLLIFGSSFVSGMAYFALWRGERRYHQTSFDRVRVLERAVD